MRRQMGKMRKERIIEEDEKGEEEDEAGLDDGNKIEDEDDVRSK